MQDSLQRHPWERTDLVDNIVQFRETPSSRAEMDGRFRSLFIHGESSPACSADADVSMFGILEIWAGEIVECELGVVALEHVAIARCHAFARLGWEVQVEEWGIPCGGVDYGAYEGQSVGECGCDVGFEPIVGRKVESLVQEFFGSGFNRRASGEKGDCGVVGSGW